MVAMGHRWVGVVLLSLLAGACDGAAEASSESCSAGQRVIFSSYAGTEIKDDGVEHIIMSETDILAIVES